MSLVTPIDLAVLLGGVLLVVGLAYFSMALAMALVALAGAALMTLGLKAIVARRRPRSRS